MSELPTANGTTSGGAPASCAALEQRLSIFEASGELPFTPAEIEHLSSCRACRAAVASVDLAALFSILALETKEGAFWSGFETRVLATVREEARASRAGWLGALLRPRAALLAVSACAIAVAALVLLRPEPVAPAHDGSRAVGGPSDAGPAPAESRIAVNGTALSTAESRIAANGLAPIPASALGAIDLQPLERNVASPPPIETVTSPTARVLTINVKDGAPDEADVVVIVDQGIDI